jgi:hypothetical protein
LFLSLWYVVEYNKIIHGNWNMVNH